MAYDLAGYWAHAAKGNNPEGSTRYNFAGGQGRCHTWAVSQAADHRALACSGRLHLRATPPRARPTMQLAIRRAPLQSLATNPAPLPAVSWYPRTMLADLLALPDWAAVKASVERMLALGMLRQLVPFGEWNP